MTVVQIVRRNEVPSTLAVERLRDQLAQAKGLDEIKRIGDVARAMREAAKALEAGKAIAVHAGDVVVEADRLMGQLTAKLQRAPAAKGEGRGRIVRPSVGPTKNEALRELGITKQRASECERAASLPEKDLAVYRESCHRTQQPPTTTSVAKLAALEPPVRKQVLAKLGDVADVRKAIAEVRRSVGGDEAESVRTRRVLPFSSFDEETARGWLGDAMHELLKLIPETHYDIMIAELDYWKRQVERRKKR